MPFVEINEMTMFYEVRGSGTPLILLHGGLDTSKNWETIAPKLAEQFQVFTLDSRGHGRSNNLSGKISYRQMADDVAAFVNALKIDKPFAGGWSDGGQIALELGMHYSELFSGLIVGAAWYTLTDAMITTFKAMGFNGVGSVDHDQLRAVAEHMGALDDYIAQHPGGLEQLFAIADALSVPWLTDLDYKPDDFAKISVPVLIMQGDRDQYIDVQQSVDMYRRIPQAELAVIPHMDHYIPDKLPDRFIATVSAFIARHTV